jgi:hypothetical protein
MFVTGTNVAAAETVTTHEALLSTVLPSIRLTVIVAVPGFTASIFA